MLDKELISYYALERLTVEMIFIILATLARIIGFVIKVCFGSGQRSSKRVKGDHPEGWSVIDYPLESLDVGLDTTNSPVVGGAPVHGFHPLPGPSGSDDPARS